MKYLKIMNTGVMDLNAIALVGASTKREQIGMIGQYGSGLSYAISSMLKKGWNFRIFAGINEIKITTKTEMMRDLPFDIIYVNGQRTSLTVGMGNEDWDDPFFAFREIISNAIDEQDFQIVRVDEVNPTEDTTAFYIEINEDNQHIVDNVDDYFKFDVEPITVCTRGAMIPVESTTELVIYRKGVRTLTFPVSKPIEIAFDLEIYQGDINESRVYQDKSGALKRCFLILLNSNNKALIDGFLSDSTVEGTLAHILSNSLMYGLYFISSDVVTENVAESLKDKVVITPEALKANIHNISEREQESIVQINPNLMDTLISYNTPMTVYGESVSSDVLSVRGLESTLETEMKNLHKLIKEYKFGAGVKEPNRVSEIKYAIISNGGSYVFKDGILYIGSHLTTENMFTTLATAEGLDSTLTLHKIIYLLFKEKNGEPSTKRTQSIGDTREHESELES